MYVLKSLLILLHSFTNWLEYKSFTSLQLCAGKAGMGSAGTINDIRYVAACLYYSTRDCRIKG
jgi:hypothetical protein